jgi:hypothetical protein
VESFAPRGSNGEKRPGDTVGTAIMVANIATGEMEEVIPAKGAMVVRRVPRFEQPS